MYTYTYSYTYIYIYALEIFIYIYIHIQLVGGFNPSEKYEFINWDDDILNRWKH